MQYEWTMRCKADPGVVEFYDFIAEQAGRCFSVRDPQSFVLAVHEAVVNSVKAVCSFAGSVSVTIQVSQDAVSVTVEDEGSGIPRDVVERLRMQTFADVAFAESGRGLLLIREIMDEVSFLPKGSNYIINMKMKRLERGTGWQFQGNAVK